MRAAVLMVRMITVAVPMVGITVIVAVIVVAVQDEQDLKS
jgi:hypothetical protein